MREPYIMTVFAAKTVALLVFIALNTCSGTVEEFTGKVSHEIKWTHSTVLDESLSLSWTSDDENRITFMVEAGTKGCFILGFSNFGSIGSADIIIGWVDDATGKPHLLDIHGYDKNSTKLLDDQQNYKIMNGYQNNTHTTISFHRDWNTCDEDDIILGSDTVHIHWKIQENDFKFDEKSLNLILNNLLHQSEKWFGSRSLHLLGKSATQNIKKDDKKYWDVKLDNFAIPDNMDTFYWCKIFKVPPLGKKHHIIGYEPLLSNNSSSLVHHMLLYACVDVKLERYIDYYGSSCYADNMPQDWNKCLSPVVAWAIGSQGEFYPEHVGLPLAEDKSTYFMLEIHYDNPTFKKVADSSGLRIYYTDNLREYDGGVLVSGVAVSPLHIIPPRQRSFRTAGYCDQHCTSLMLPKAGIRTVSVLLHSHLAGRKITLKHIRDNVELPSIAKDKNYDFNYQQSRLLSKEIRILPGDELVTECVYDTRNRTELTFGGYSTKQEMCLAFIVYYPLSPLANCVSMTPVEYFFKTFGVTEFYKYNMSTVEKMFLKLTDNQISKPESKTTTPPNFSAIDEFDEAANEAAIKKLKEMADFIVEESEGSGNLLSDLVIKKSAEFANKSFTAHLHHIPWQENILTQRIEDAFYHGQHMTFCRLSDDTLAMPSRIYQFPNFTELSNQNRSTNETKCNKKENKIHLELHTPSSSSRVNVLILPFYLVFYYAIYTLLS